MRCMVFFSLFTFATFTLASDPPAKDKPAPKANRLAKESSPYLRQHGHNPVDWYPWGAEAFDKAKKENKLVFLSIGYSSCHWCHVMEKECFSDPALAKQFNDSFVCIKVDREERPDVDEVYMTSLQVLGNSGGWPLSMFLTPDAKPIFGGTYWPKDDRIIEGETINGCSSILKEVNKLWAEKKPELLKQADKVAELTVESMERTGRAIPLVRLDRAAIKEAAEEFEFDPVHGGFGSRSRLYKGPKFPRAAGLQFLWKYSESPGQDSIRRELDHALQQMASGGIYDHVGGGFHRYSTERTWTVPHFEKMLYDNAQLVELYSLAYRSKSNTLVKKAIEETLEFIKREMTSPEGGFYSALDADSEGREGEFYIWTLDQLQKVLSADELTLARKAFVLDKPNFEGKSFVLRFPDKFDGELLVKLAPIQAKLLAARSKRERPFLDTKIITSWNGQMVAAYAMAGTTLKNPEYTKRAESAANFVLTNLRKDGRLLRTFAAKPNEAPAARGHAFLEDYAFLTHGLLNLYDAKQDKRWLTEAINLVETAVRFHGDSAKGGFYSTAHDHEKLFARGKDNYDGAQPSGNGVMTRNLVRLAILTGDSKWKVEAEKSLKLFAGAVKSSPTSAPVTAEAAMLFLAKYPTEPNTTAATPAPAPPKASADVLTAKATHDGDKLTITLTMTKPWHIYANPAGGTIPVESQTAVEIWLDGKRTTATAEYPKSEAHTDSTGAKYNIYSGTQSFNVPLPPEVGKDVKIEVRVSIVACKDGTCLLPSTLKLTPTSK